MTRRRQRSTQSGSAMVEFSLVCFVMILCVLASMEFNRLVLVYSTLGNAARAGNRYAIVHGGYRTGTGDPASGATDKTNVITVVKNFASAGLLKTSRLTVTVDYPDSTSNTDPGNRAGSTVVVSVSYPYDPFTILPMSVTLRSAARGVIVF